MVITVLECPNVGLMLDRAINNILEYKMQPADSLYLKDFGFIILFVLSQTPSASI